MPKKKSAHATHEAQKKLAVRMRKTAAGMRKRAEKMRKTSREDGNQAGARIVRDTNESH